MPVFAANLSMLWQELGPYDRFAAASAAGVRRYRLARRHGDRHLPVALPVRKSA